MLSNQNTGEVNLANPKTPNLALKLTQAEQENESLRTTIEILKQDSNQIIKDKYDENKTVLNLC